jgi:thioredoxin 1
MSSRLTGPLLALLALFVAIGPVRAGDGHLRSFKAADFQAEVLQSELPVLVFFKATWAGPCKAMIPVIEAIAEELVGKVVVGTIDIDDAPELTRRYSVRSVPTFMVFKGGAPAGSHIGLTTKEKLLRLMGVVVE